MRDKNVAALLALFLGAIGAHKFYLGKIGTGIVYLVLSFSMISAILGLIDFFILAMMDPAEFNRRHNGSNTLGPGVVVNMLPGATYPQPGGHYGQPGGHYGQPGAPYGGYGPAYPPAGYPPAPGYPPGSYAMPPQSHASYGPPGHAPPPQLPPPSQAPWGGQPSTGLATDDLAAKLDKLNELRIAGLLTEAEFTAQKTRLLNQV